ncbi:MAG TPA: hypothetical protein VE967_04665, partial [Gemmatimonadaceae bacterium]|nr:hypothetical protein [Gemmatimonadaceae bacterium]
GLVCAVLFTRVLRTFLYQVGTSDPGTFAVIVLVLLATVLIATLIPARRAASIDPVRALK